ncbi:hypothetical protein PF008_g25056 [Phytophthora fragariae]|uniref:Uncharacterized protein n=1 Tax=Phytophthora fragariae TaxID=53985 RepID=A0A6G0QL17_9STRA|nr:hypothetical protein PF008_g25056 [Phytophthora fragariae]
MALIFGVDESLSAARSEAETRPGPGTVGNGRWTSVGLVSRLAASVIDATSELASLAEEADTSGGTLRDTSCKAQPCRDLKGLAGGWWKLHSEGSVLHV